MFFPNSYLTLKLKIYPTTSRKVFPPAKKINLVILRSDVTFKKWVKSYEVLKLATPEFQRKFQFYAKKGNLKSGLMISKRNAVLWFEEAGLFNKAFDPDTFAKHFTAAAGNKVVMSAYEFIRFLMRACLGRMHVTDVIENLLKYQDNVKAKPEEIDEVTPIKESECNQKTNKINECSESLTDCN